MLQDFSYQRLLNINDYHAFEKDFLSQQIEQIGPLSQLLSVDEKDTKQLHLHNLNKQSTEEMNIEESKDDKPSKQKKKRIRKYTSNNPNNKKGHWSLQETLKYHYFLEINARHFIDSQRRKIDKIFKSMASFIGSREAHQCRSHHQKIEKKWGSFPKILLNLRLENFSQTSKDHLIERFSKAGLTETPESDFFENYELQNQPQLYKTIVEQRLCKQECQQVNCIQQDNSVGQGLVICHKNTCMCLMMSEKYEDHLHF